MTWLIYALLALCFLSSIRIFIGPSFQDRLLATSVVQALVLVLVCVVAVDYNITYYLDIALLLALLSFAGIIAFARLLQKVESFGRKKND